MYKVAYSSQTVQLVEPWEFPSFDIACEFINNFKELMGGTFTLLDDDNRVIASVTGNKIVC